MAKAKIFTTDEEAAAYAEMGAKMNASHTKRTAQKLEALRERRKEQPAGEPVDTITAALSSVAATRGVLRLPPKPDDKEGRDALMAEHIERKRRRA